jgi:5-oxopent-3-ene-1,2,5-tricarboxylate decarboxylase/2-hydroxyhepta-2,4-diene-1,7-dioate isomerase
MTHPALSLSFAPWRLSGTVVGPLLNDPATLAVLGEAVHAAPYKAPPQAPVLQVKPRNTVAASPAVVVLPDGEAAFEIGATLGLVIGRTACRVSAGEALGHVAGCLLVADLSLPHAGHYRPAARAHALDGSCVMGVPAAGVPDIESAAFVVSVDGEARARFTLAGLVRPAARLVADVSEFMTLHPGDVLLLGARQGAPQVRAGQRFSVEGAGLPAVAAQVMRA